MTDANASGGQKALNDALEALTPVLREQAAQALTALSGADETYEKHARKSLACLQETAHNLTTQRIDEVSAALSMDNCLESLKLLVAGEQNRARVQSFQRGVAILGVLKSVLLSTTRLALNVYAPGAGEIVRKLDLDRVVLDTIIQTPKLA